MSEHEQTERGDFGIDLRGITSADLAGYIAELQDLMGKGAEASRFRLYATALALMRQELRRRGDSDDPGAIVGFHGVPDDVIEEAKRIMGGDN